jgi:D-glycero-D-manno-heptose 1,7-bisphosphate phosphatase
MTEILSGNKEELIEIITKSFENEFIYSVDPGLDLGYFKNHAIPGTVGLHFGKGSLILENDGTISMITTSDYADGYTLTGPFYLEKSLMLKFLESGELPLEKIKGLPIVRPPKGEKRPALFLDRDGVINEDKNYVGKIEQLTFFEGINEIIKFAKDKNWYVIVLTNQSGIGRGMFSTEEVEKLHAYMSEELKNKGAFIDDWFYAPYHQEGGVGEYKKFSFLRKPYPGMALKACEKYPIDIDKSFMIGDKLTDELFLPGLRPIHITRGSDLSEAQAPVFKTYKEILNYLKSST